MVKEYKFKAVEVGTSIEGQPLAAPRFRKLLKTIEQLGCFVFTHPYQCLAQGGMDDYYLRNFVGDTNLMLGYTWSKEAVDYEVRDNVVIDGRLVYNNCTGLKESGNQELIHPAPRPTEPRSMPCGWCSTPTSV